MVTWLAWILGVATTSAAANRNVSIVLAAITRLPGTRGDNSPIHSRIKRSPRGRSTRIDHRWIIDESQRDTDTALARDVAEPEVLRGHCDRDKRIIICASAINASCRLMSERKIARSFFSFFPSLSFSPRFLYLSPHSFRSTCQRYEG